MSASGRQLRVGLVGSGKMGMHHLRAIAASQMATVVAVADPVATLDELRPLLADDAIVVASVPEMLERARLDVVHVVTPPHTHAEIAGQVIAGGCHVYVEKPFTPTSAEASAVLAAAAAGGVKVCAGHQVLFEAPALAAREGLASIGRLVHIESYFSFRMVRRTITEAEQVKDILPHAIYPVVDQLRAGTGLDHDPIEIVGMSLDAGGDAYVLLRLGRATAIVMVTLNGRPVEQYQNIIGSNGSLRADYIGGFLGRLVGPGTGPGVVLTPFRRGLGAMAGTTKGIAKLVRGGSYPGLRTLVRRFYESIANGMPSPVTPRSIHDTVELCERVGLALDDVVERSESRARSALLATEASQAPLSATAPLVLLTGGTGLLGRRIAEELRGAGYGVRVLARRVPAYSRRLPGVQYHPADLARGIEPSLMAGVTFVVHAAAETSGGKEEHRRNSIDATRQVLESAARANVRGVVHISSLAVIKTSREVGQALTESTPIDAGSLNRGPYVWGKAESEVLAQQLGKDLAVPVRVIRPGPLVDYSSYAPPGRLGREVGPMFVAIGPRRGDLSVCDVTTAAKVIRSYLDRFDEAPPVLNLVEAPPPTRHDLMRRFVQGRPDLRVFWVPAWFLRALSGPLKLLQRYALGAKEPLDVAAAFASERYDTTLAAAVIAKSELRT